MVISGDTDRTMQMILIGNLLLIGAVARCTSVDVGTFAFRP